MSIQETMSIHSIHQNIKLVAQKSTDLKVMVQEIANAIIIRTHLHKNCDGALELVAAIGKNSKQGSLKRYLESAGLTFYKNKKKENKVGVKFQPSVEQVKELIETCWTSGGIKQDEKTEQERLAKRIETAKKLLTDQGFIVLTPAELEAYNNQSQAA